MVIHPQVLFIGFTSMSVPFAYAVAGMLKRDYVSWIRVSTPWTVFGAMVLGTGVVMGGFWAYETLGWGGYWGWDPVENSSLVPWLVCVASIHTMLSQRRSGSFIKTNFVLSILCFIMVLYSTFLTRSGVLGDTSVHSFVEPGMLVYWMLLAGLFLFAAIGFGLFFARMKEMPKVPVEHSILIAGVCAIPRRISNRFCCNVHRHWDIVPHHHQHSQRKSFCGRFVVLCHDNASAWSIYCTHGGNRPIIVVEELGY